MYKHPFNNVDTVGGSCTTLSKTWRLSDVGIRPGKRFNAARSRLPGCRSFSRPGRCTSTTQQHEDRRRWLYQRPFHVETVRGRCTSNHSTTWRLSEVGVPALLQQLGECRCSSTSHPSTTLRLSDMGVSATHQ